MSTMIRDVKPSRKNLSNDHYMLANMQSLHKSWEALNLALTSNKNKKCDDISHHLELEAKCHGVNGNAAFCRPHRVSKPLGQKCERQGK